MRVDAVANFPAGAASLTDAGDEVRVGQNEINRQGLDDARFSGASCPPLELPPNWKVGGGRRNPREPVCDGKIPS